MLTTELTWLVCTAILAASLWIPFIVGVNRTEFEGKDTIFERPPELGRMAPWVQRAYRAHLNLLEQLLPFSLMVLVGALAHVSTPVTVWCAVLFFWLRVAHAIGMISGIAKFPVRPMIYVAGWIVTLLFAWQVLTAA
jgi:uncharacterized MAPEG superfamily protein